MRTFRCIEFWERTPNCSIRATLLHLWIYYLAAYAVAPRRIPIWNGDLDLYSTLGPLEILKSMTISIVDTETVHCIGDPHSEPRRVRRSITSWTVVADHYIERIWSTGCAKANVARSRNA